jgi:TPR repeat protein
LKAAQAGVQDAAAHALNSAVRLSLLTGNPPSIPDAVLQEGLNYSKARAKAKYDGSCITLGEMYLWGFYVSADEQEGVRWLEMRALAGDAVACTALVHYFSGQFAPPGKQTRVEDASKARYYSELMSGINSFFPY